MTKKKTNSKKKPATAKPKQPELPTLERKKDKELDGMILALHETRTERIELQKDENEMATALIEKMKAKKKTAYVCIDGETKYTCNLFDGPEKVKVKQEDA